MRSISGIGFIAAAISIWPAAGAEQAASIPALSGEWGRTNFNLEQPPLGPDLIVNRMRKPDGTVADDAGRVGDYTNPLLKPEAAAILKKRGEYSLTGQSIP